MGRSHAWLLRGPVSVEPRPRNWGDNLTMVGAMRRDRWLTLSMFWGAMNTARFVAWVSRRLVPQLRVGDIVVLDNLAAHKARAVRMLVAQAGVTVAPRTGPALRATVQRARRVVKTRHCRNWFAHAGYDSQLN